MWREELVSHQPLHFRHNRCTDFDAGGIEVFDEETLEGLDSTEGHISLTCVKSMSTTVWSSVKPWTLWMVVAQASTKGN